MSVHRMSTTRVRGTREVILPTDRAAANEQYGFLTLRGRVWLASLALCVTCWGLVIRACEAILPEVQR